MKGITHYLDVPEGQSLSDEFIRRVLGHPKTGPKAIVQAQLSAHALEQDRQETPVYADLMRRRRELKEELDRVERSLDDLDALRVLERRS